MRDRRVRREVAPFQRPGRINRVRELPLAALKMSAYLLVGEGW
jgi:hypothetical protein